MDPKAENVIQNVGAIAEAVSVFYNSMIRQVPKDVALVLTRHFMDLTIQRRDRISALDAKALAIAAAEARRRTAQQKRQSGQGTPGADTKPETPQPPASSSPREKPPQDSPDLPQTLF